VASSDELGEGSDEDEVPGEGLLKRNKGNKEARCLKIYAKLHNDGKDKAFWAGQFLRKECR